jgi:hypothetical protein
MAQSELSTRRGDDTAELRARYNQLCAALTMSAGTNSTVADRVLQELQALAQKIAFRQAERDSASRPPASAAPPSAAPRTEARPAHGKGNVIAFRCRVKGRSRENPRLPAALSALTDRTPVPFESSPERPQAIAPTPPSKAQAAPPTPVEPPVAAAIAKQGAELERLVRKSEDQTRILELLEGRLGKSEGAPQLSAEVAALRSAAARQGEQLVSLATAVHRLAKLLAAHPPQDGR